MTRKGTGHPLNPIWHKTGATSCDDRNPPTISIIGIPELRSLNPYLPSILCIANVLLLIAMGCCIGKPALSKEVLDTDIDKDGLISKDELSTFIARNEKLYVMLAVNLGLPEEKCREIATEVAYQMSKRSRPDASLRELTDSTRIRQPTVQEFQGFLDFLEQPKGQQEFFHRTVFATYDVDQSGYIEPHELDNFLDVFYQAGSIFAGDVRLPKKAKLKKEVMRQLDTNKDGKLEFSELRTLISGGARAGLHFTDDDYVDSGEEREKERAAKEAADTAAAAEAAKKKTEKRKKHKKTEKTADGSKPKSSKGGSSKKKKKSSSSSGDPADKEKSKKRRHHKPKAKEGESSEAAAATS